MIITMIGDGLRWVVDMGIVPLTVAAVSLGYFIKHIAAFKLKGGLASGQRLSLWAVGLQLFWPVVLYFAFQQAGLLVDGHAHRYMILTWWLGPALHFLLIVMLTGPAGLLSAFPPVQPREADPKSAAQRRKAILIATAIPSTAALLLLLFVGDAMFTPCPTNWTGGKCRGYAALYGPREDPFGGFFLSFMLVFLFTSIQIGDIFRNVCERLEQKSRSNLSDRTTGT